VQTSHDIQGKFGRLGEDFLFARILRIALKKLTLSCSELAGYANYGGGPSQVISSRLPKRGKNFPFCPTGCTLKREKALLVSQVNKSKLLQRLHLIYWDNFPVQA
jgi:hypothetical protein